MFIIWFRILRVKVMEQMNKQGDNNHGHARFVGILVDLALVDGQCACPLFEILFRRKELLLPAL